MNLTDALGELSMTVNFLKAQSLASELDPSKELRRLGQAVESLKTSVQVDKEPNRIEIALLVDECRRANFNLQQFSRRDIRLLTWDDGLLMEAAFRQNLLALVADGQVRPNLSVLSKIYFGTWGEQVDAASFERLLLIVAENQTSYSEIYQLYKRHSSDMFSSSADTFLVNEIFASEIGLQDVLKRWDVPAKSCLAVSVIHAYLQRSLALIEDGQNSNVEGIARTLRLPGVRLEAVRKAAERLILCRQADRVDEFRKAVEVFVLEHPQLGDPRYQSNAPHWTGIAPKAEQTFRGWRNKVDLVFFFNSVMNDNGDRHGRKLFWLRYVNLAHESFVALCPTDAYRLRTSLWREKIQYRKIVDDQEVSCFVMRFKGYSEDIAIAEFSNVGSARIFPYKSFIQKIGSVDRQTFGLKELRNDTGASQSFRHVNGWQLRVRNALAGYGIRPI